ncbi:MAG: endolytic transglycosylase MltG [Dehalococcoidia bacterium]
MNVALAAGALAAVALVAGAVWFSTTGTDGILADDASVEIEATDGETVAVTIEAGQSVREIGDQLQEAGVLDSALRFRVLASLTGRGSEIKAGDYELSLGMTANQVLGVLTTIVEERTVILTIPEGWRIEEMADRVAELEIATREEFIAAASRTDYDFEFLAGLPAGANLEGYLFPDTYEIAEEATAETVVLLMLQNFERRVTPEMIAGFEAHGLNLHQAVTLASIIEREAVVPEERPIMAGVFYNRLAAGDIFGADPTVQYILGNSPESVAFFGYWKVGLTTEDIAIAVSPYNTYQNAGLPPGPIAAPGLSALEAVAFADPTDFYFFYACGEDGVHTFSVTQAEHDAAQAACLG